MKQHPSRRLSSLCGLLAIAACACNSLTGLDDFTVEGKTAGPDCTTNKQCSDRATTANGSPVAAVCVQPEGKCVELLSEDCDTITGDPLDGDPIILGTLFTTAMTNLQRATNLQRQQSAQLAVEEINKIGGVPAAAAGQNRKLVLLSCDESVNLERAARHLVDELHVPGIVGPNTSQDTLDLSSKHSVKGGTVVMTPTGVASSITALIDNDLTWQMVPTDVQRAPLMIQQINEIETRLKSTRSATVKLGIVFRDDALGIGTRTALSNLVLNGKPITDATNFPKNVLIEGYDFSKPDQAALVTKVADFAPDIVVLAGTAEAINQVMKPLEVAWKAANRPEYVLIDSVKVPDLITLIKDTNNANDLRRRVRGTGIKPGVDTAAAYGTFQLEYNVAFGSAPTASGTGPSYDAAYSLAYALAATRDEPPSGAAVAKGLRRLAGGTTTIPVGGTTATTAFQKLASGEKIKGLGTFGPLDWDANGAVVGGTLEMWCIGAPGGTPAYQNSGLTFDIKTGMATGMYTQCEN